MANAIQKVEQPQALAPFFSPEQEKMILSSFLGDASKEEAAVLMEVARVRRLNPMLRQIHFVKRYDGMKRMEVWSYQTSIDGLRAIAERTGRYEGQSEPQWCGKDGAWRSVWLEKEPPAAARVGVYKAGFREPLYGIARWDTYVQTKRDGGVTQFWARMPDLMLSKCAEALALRKAFPEDMGGLYTAEEMGGDEAQAEPRPASQPAARIAPAPRESHVEREVADPTPQERNDTRALVEAAASTQQPVPKGHTPANAKRAQAIWKRGTDAVAPGHNLTVPGMWAFVERELGSRVQPKDWTPAQMDTLEAALSNAEQVP